MKWTTLSLSFFVCTMAFSQSNGNRAIDSLLFEASKYTSGAGRDDAKAFEIYKLCATMGHARSMNTVGLMYKRGRGVTANGIEAANWFQLAGESGCTQGWYNLGIHYKNMKPPSQDFSKAYECFSKGTERGDSVCEFMQGYLRYKGLGCEQDYSQAFSHFKRAADKRVSNSVYFLGLCYRNGYGVQMNEDSARYWLQLASRMSNRQAMMELTAEEAENGNLAAKEQAQRISNAAFPVTTSSNQYQRMKEELPANIVTGKFTGHLITYDWSGKNVIGVSPLALELYVQKGTLYGIWVEGDSLRVPVAARLSAGSIEFLNTSYKRTDHYSPDTPIPYNFESASLHWTSKNDTVFLAGDVRMFSPARNEPHKPLSVALIKTGKITDTEIIKLADVKDIPEDQNKLIVYPNPFNDIITLQFALKEKSDVTTKIVTVDGKVVYSNRSGKLDAGYYTLPLLPGHLPAGTYFMVLKYGTKTKTTKMIKR